MSRPTLRNSIATIAAGGMLAAGSFMASPAHAACGSFSFSSLDASFSEKCGDKTFSNFIGFDTSLGGTVQLIDGGLSHSLVFNFTPDLTYTVVPYSFTYDVKVDAPNYVSSLGSSVSAFGTTPAVMTMLDASPVAGTIASDYTLSAVLDFGLSSTDTVVDTWSHDILQAAVPGPLPILGAGAAFGFSRKLRKRIKSVA